MKKLFLLFVKFMPVIQMAGILVNNTLCMFDINHAINYILDFTVGIVISDNPEDMIKEYDGMISNSRQVLESVDYHKSVLDSRDEIMVILNPLFAKEKEQETKLSNLEGRVGNMEQGIGDIKSMLAKLLNDKQKE